MKLTTGKEIPDRFLTDAVEGIVEVYASYGFTDWAEAIDVETRDWSWQGIEKTDYPSLEMDYLRLEEAEIDEIIEIVEPVAKQFAAQLDQKFQELYWNILESGSKVWINSKLPRE